MISNPEEAFRHLIPTEDPFLRKLEKEAQTEGIPIVGPVVGELLYLLARVSGARHILELGCATGYSAIHLARALDTPEGRVITLENNQDMAARAQINFRQAGLEDRIEIRMGDALETMAALSGPFDLVFLDFEKAAYIGALPHCERLLRERGLLVADNVAFKDAEDFNRALYQRPGWRPVHLLSFLPLHSPERDGICLAVRD
jgi:predicted O-methyltransferase YrrM